MPNWCSNILVIRGTKQQRENFKNKYCELVKVGWNDKEVLSISFNKVIPEPTSIEECPEEYILRTKEDARREHLEWDENNPRKWFNWYKFHCNKWGCKWDCDPSNAEETDTALKLHFATPWGPPYGIIVKFIEDNSGLKISGRFDEPNMDLHGSYTYKNYQKYFN